MRIPLRRHLLDCLAASGTFEPRLHHLSRSLSNAATHLLLELRVRHEADRAAPWAEAERREHCAVVPAVARFLHERLTQAQRPTPARRRTRCPPADPSPPRDPRRTLPTPHLAQYHHSFADAVNVPAGVLAEIVGAYFTLFDVANQFADAAQVTRGRDPARLSPPVTRGRDPARHAAR